MCIAIPAEVIEKKEGNIGVVDYGDLKQEVRLDLVDVDIGEFVLVHVGFAIQKLSRNRSEGLSRPGTLPTGIRGDGRAVIVREYSFLQSLIPQPKGNPGAGCEKDPRHVALEKYPDIERPDVSSAVAKNPGGERSLEMYSGPSLSQEER